MTKYDTIRPTAISRGNSSHLGFMLHVKNVQVCHSGIGSTTEMTMMWTLRKPEIPKNGLGLLAIQLLSELQNMKLIHERQAGLFNHDVHTCSVIVSPPFNSN